MLEAKELKVVLSALSQQRNKLLSALDDRKTEEKQRQEYSATIKYLDSAMKKLASGASPQKTKAPPPPPAQQAAPPPPAKKPAKRYIEFNNAHVLIAEDNAEAASLMQALLEDMGFKHIDIAEDGKEAADMLQSCSPAYDLVLCDWDMPEMSGLEVRKTVRPLAKLRDTHFMMVTGVTDASRIKEAIQNGIHDYIAKPVDANILEKKLKVALQSGKPPKN